ncbi:MAG: hypothetical protein ACLU3F_00020 [Blautia wexlerae]
MMEQKEEKLACEDARSGKGDFRSMVRDDSGYLGSRTENEKSFYVYMEDDCFS